jgi:hypothetical protein
MQARQFSRIKPAVRDLQNSQRQAATKMRDALGEMQQAFRRGAGVGAETATKKGALLVPQRQSANCRTVIRSPCWTRGIK